MCAASIFTQIFLGIRQRRSPETRLAKDAWLSPLRRTWRGKSDGVGDAGMTPRGVAITFPQITSKSRATPAPRQQSSRAQVFYQASSPVVRSILKIRAPTLAQPRRMPYELAGRQNSGLGLRSMRISRKPRRAHAFLSAYDRHPSR